MYSGKTSPSIASHSPFASQQKDIHSERWHSCVPKNIRSGLGLNVGEDASSTRGLIGGRDPKRFQVMATSERASCRRTDNLMLWSDSYFCIQYYLKRWQGKLFFSFFLSPVMKGYLDTKLSLIALSFCGYSNNTNRSRLGIHDDTSDIFILYYKDLFKGSLQLLQIVQSIPASLCYHCHIFNSQNKLLSQSVVGQREYFFEALPADSQGQYTFLVVLGSPSRSIHHP